MYASVRIYKTKIEKLDDALIRRVQDEFANILRSVSGFHAYRLIDSGNYQVASMSFFETEQGASESVDKSLEWVTTNLADLIDGDPVVFVGQQVFSELA